MSVIPLMTHEVQNDQSQRPQAFSFRLHTALFRFFPFFFRYFMALNGAFFETLIPAFLNNETPHGEIR
ncbi:MAG: hypothetical protein VR64_23130 [Desulfatitalea sp. BRH_c12]|nr:MAG: hypothetical protein VR64_23130 [Desulfatitalea sp. BRH_c12]